MKFFVTCWACLVLALVEGNENRGQPQRHQSLSDSIRLLDVTRGVLRKVTKIGFLSRLPYVEWIVQKLDTVHLYVSAGQALAAKLDPDLLEALAGVAGSGRREREERRSTMNDYILNWRYKPAAIPAYIRKKSKPIDDLDEEIDEDFSASHSSHDRGYYGGGHGGGYGGGGYGGGGYGGGGYGGGGDYGGGGYGGGGHGGGGHGGGSYGMDSSGKAFSILGGLSFLTFLGVLLYQLATQSAATGRVMDADAPLFMSDFHNVDRLLMENPLLFTKDLNDPPSMTTAEEENSDILDQTAGIFNGLWRAHQLKTQVGRGYSRRCTQRRICETLTANKDVAYDPLVQIATIGMAYWLGEHDSAYTVDRVMQAALGVDSGNKSADGSTILDLCSTIVPKCRSLQSAPLMLSSATKGRLKPLADDDATVSTRNEITWS
ncbi:uncharacterized protein LOC116923439 [Daphnia magna]|uniref:uncharacterized protein LOC116923439 n=1 Tax=Daphnia magna TaxID=35525 RepID=UPI001E1BAD04|nr:uncharacterized protein LOC116923439 [Daphnia magna]